MISLIFHFLPLLNNNFHEILLCVICLYFCSNYLTLFPLIILPQSVSEGEDTILRTATAGKPGRLDGLSFCEEIVAITVYARFHDMVLFFFPIQDQFRHLFQFSASISFSASGCRCRSPSSRRRGSWSRHGRWRRFDERRQGWQASTDSVSAGW